MGIFVYILRCQRDGSLYVGHTNNLARRLISTTIQPARAIPPNEGHGLSFIESSILTAALQ
ncbi:hypothetical protein LCGC14_0312540 [marine sediment metagenome]|uniref:GIY-YIG domain-containing protein n=1 Tax=marine sediment metagenome TaxID=412755 RepID=A0A0F9U4B1_9ZZZZ